MWKFLALFSQFYYEYKLPKIVFTLENPGGHWLRDVYKTINLVSAIIELQGGMRHGSGSYHERDLVDISAKARMGEIIGCPKFSDSA